MTDWNGSRAAKCERRKDGTFKRWAKGEGKKQTSHKPNPFKGIKIHLSAEYERQHRRKPRIGSIVRTKKKDGTYHKGAFWYVRAFNGWKRFGIEKPTRADVIRYAVIGIRLYATGDIATAARELGITPETVIRYIKERSRSRKH